MFVDFQLSVLHAWWSKSKHSESWAKIFDWNAWSNNNWAGGKIISSSFNCLTKIFQMLMFQIIWLSDTLAITSDHFGPKICFGHKIWSLWPKNIITLDIKSDHFGHKIWSLWPKNHFCGSVIKLLIRVFCWFPFVGCFCLLQPQVFRSHQTFLIGFSGVSCYLPETQWDMKHTMICVSPKVAPLSMRQKIEIIK